MQNSYLNQKLNQTKDMALNRVLIVMLFIMIPGLLITLLRLPQTGFTINYGVQILSGVSIIMLYVLRRKLPIQTKGIIFLAVLYTMALSGLLSFGLYGFGYIYFIPAASISFIYFSKKTGWYITLSSIVIIAIIGVLFNKNVFHFTPPHNSYMQSAAMWLNMIITISIIAIVMTMFWSNLHSMLTNTFTHINNQQNDMKKMNADLIEARDKAQQSDRMKSSFLQNISHEIRTPLNIIIGFSDMLAQTNNADEQKEYNRVIKENSNSMLKIVNDIVDFSKIETNTFTLNTDSFEVYDVLIQIEKEIGIENIKSLCINIDKIKRVIKTDKERFYQILYNLLNNAIRFTHKGSITLSIENDDNLLSFIIQDTGIGISPKNSEKIFERFYKVDDFSGGAGLGLSISQSIARFMGGDIVLVDSKPGSGSVFKFTFPIV